MPFNLLITYNQLLDISGMSVTVRKASLKGVFEQDIVNHPNFTFRGKKITPTPQDGEIKMETLFRHLTTVVVDKKTKARDFDIHRARRLHWVKYHIEGKKKNDMLIFSVKEPEGIRTYIYDVLEKYVIVLEPLRKKNEYYLLTAYHVRGKDAERDKFIRKHKRKLKEVL